VAFDPKPFEVVPGKSLSDTKLKLAMNKDEYFNERVVRERECVHGGPDFGGVE